MSGIPLLPDDMRDLVKMRGQLESSEGPTTSNVCIDQGGYAKKARSRLQLLIKHCKTEIKLRKQDS